MKTLLSSMIVVTLALTACGESPKSSDEEKAAPVEQVIPAPQVTPVEKVAPAAKNMDKPSFSASRSLTERAKVEAINLETREVTLLQKEGSKLNFIVSEQARNLDQVQVGDIVIATYLENMTAKVVSVEDAQAGAGVIEAQVRAEEGEMPAALKGSTIVVTATIEDINTEANTFKLKGPKGNVKQFTARNPENLKKAAVGDLVVITYTKAIALSVEKAK